MVKRIGIVGGGPPLICGAALTAKTLKTGGVAVAFIGDRRARSGRLGWLQSPLVYTLSISVYCTSWTFYGAVGSAARNGLEFATIYVGPTLVFVGWWICLRKIVHIGRTQGITSIADMISSRYGKSASLAALVTLIAVVSTTGKVAPLLVRSVETVALVTTLCSRLWNIDSVTCPTLLK